MHVFKNEHGFDIVKVNTSLFYSSALVDQNYTIPQTKIKLFQCK